MLKQITSQFKIICASFVEIFKIIFKDWHYKKAFNLNNLAKLLFIYCCSIFWIIIIYFDFSTNFWQQLAAGKIAKPKLAFYSVSNRIGEHLLYIRMQKSLEQNNIEYIGASLPEIHLSSTLLRHFYEQAASILNLLFQPKFNLALTHHVNILPYGYNISYLNIPRNMLIKMDNEKTLAWLWPHLAHYDAYADLYSLCNGQNQLLQELINLGKIQKPIFPLYISENKATYVPSLPKKALITGSLWGCERSSIRMQLALRKLGENGYLDGIGLDSLEDVLQKNYLGKLENFTTNIPGALSSAEKLIQALTKIHQEYGISLIIHNLEHRLDGIPTSRIAEAITSSALIISDNHPFLIKNFGNNVLYYDSSANSTEIEEQITNHIKWAQNHPQEAMQKTHQAFEIFQSKYTIETQLNALINSVEAIK